MIEQKMVPGSVTEAVLTDRKIHVPRVLPIIILSLAVMISIFHLFTGFFGGLNPYPQRLMTLSMFMVFGFLFRPLSRKSWNSELNLGFFVDALCVLLIISGTIYVITDWYQFSAFRMSSSLPMDRVVSTIFIILLLEIGRRYLGWPIVGISIFFILTDLFSDHLWGWLYGSPVSWKTMCEVIFMQPEAGIFSTPLMVCSNYLVTFLIFVGFLQASGVDSQFISLANSLAGRYTGGPAKVAVVGSAFLGMMQGAPSANVAATGSFTIPMMEKLKYNPTVAGAIEACASTGGQLMPPIMGSTAFLIAAFLNVEYIKVCYHALIPTAIYYTCVFMGVHFYSMKKGLVGLDQKEIDPLRKSLSTSWPIILPFIVMLGLMAKGYGLGLVAVLAVVSLWIASSFKKETRLSAQGFLYAVEIGAQAATVVTIACAVVGIIIGAFYASGLGDRLSMAIVNISNGNLITALALTAVACIILGMGMVIPAVYIMMVYIAIPALIQMGVTPLSAHFFVFMFCIVAAITPPVGLALYVAAGIAEANVMDVGYKAIRLGIALFIIPFFIVLSPTLLGVGSFVEVILAAATGLIGATLMESGFEGWLFHQVNWLERAFLLCAGILLLFPGYKTDLVGAVLGAGIIVLNRTATHRRRSFFKRKHK